MRVHERAVLADADSVIGAIQDAVPGAGEDAVWLQMSFRLALAANDARLIEESAQRHGLDLPLFSTIRERLAEGAEEHGDQDFSATYLTSTPRRDSA